MSKTIIAGGRDFKPTTEWLKLVSNMLSVLYTHEIVSGGCSGADTFGENIAERLDIPCKVFLADWNKHGKGAGPIRNVEMADYADNLIALPGGKGTKSMVQCAKFAGVNVFDYEFMRNA